MKTPTPEECLAFDGAHCHALWASLPEGWSCPACGRRKLELIRWADCVAWGGRPAGWRWHTGLARHHDHGGGPEGIFARFPETVVCDLCNSADGLAKRRLKLPASWSFSPEEIGRFVTATPHGRHRVDLQAAEAIYVQVARPDPARVNGGAEPSS